MIRNTTSSWGLVQQTLHWLIVALVVAQLIVGSTLGATPADASLWRTLFPLHATIGMSIFVVMLVRLLWRVSNPVPELPDTLKPWQKTLAHGNHWLLYIILIGLPIGGYVLVSTHGQPIPFFGWSLPPMPFVPQSETLQATIKAMHGLGAMIVVVLVVLHVAAALRHGYLLKDGVLQRMAPFLK